MAISVDRTWAKSHALIDHYLRDAGIGWTILKPTAFMQNFFWFKDPIAKGFLPQIAGKGSVSWWDTRDVARVAAKVLTEDGHNHATYFLTGPETLDMKEAASRLSKVTKHKVRYLDLPNPIFKAILRLTGNSSGWPTAWLRSSQTLWLATTISIPPSRSSG